MMTPIANSEDAAAAKYALEQARIDCPQWQLFVGDSLLATIPPANYELGVAWGKLIFAWWDDRHSQNWRVTAYQIEEAETRLQVMRGVNREITTVTLRNEIRWREKAAAEDLPLPEKRRAYAQLLARLLAAHFDGARLQNVPEGDVPKGYAKLRWKVKNEVVLAIGVSEAEPQAEIDNVTAAGLVWLANFNWQQEARQKPTDQARRLWFCLPRESSQTAIERLVLLNTAHLGARVECFEVDERREELRPLQLAAQNELLNAHPHRLEWPKSDNPANGWHDRILNLAPESIEFRRLADRESYAINGLEFCRVSHDKAARATFGVAGLREENDGHCHTILSEANFHLLELLAREIIRSRSPRAPDRRHPLYRLREEAWLESLLRRDIRALDVSFDDRFVYSQIPAWRGEERSVIDLLTVKQAGPAGQTEQTGQDGLEFRLAVIEIKAAEDAQLPLQGLDYWLHVEQARLRGEFARRGLFPGIELTDRPPLLYLVAPRLRFHRSFATVARCLAPHIEAYQVGINTSWREGVRVRSVARVNQREHPSTSEFNFER